MAGTWSELQLKLAVKAVKVDKISKKQAAKFHGIPRPTLQDYGTCEEWIRVAIMKFRTKNGGPTMPSENQEEELVEIIQTMASK